MKKILSMLLSLSMALSLLIVPGFAEEAIEGEEAVLMEETSENSTETQENESVPADDTEKTLSFNEHDEVIWPCIDVVKSYLLAGAEEDVNNYEFHVPIQAEPVTLSWEAQNITPSGYTLEIATESDFSDAKTIALDADATSYGFKFLLRDTKYYVRLTTTGDDVLTANTEFSTAYGCPRFLDVGGNFNNCRDLGGYKVGDKTVLQNMVIRGSAPNNSASSNLLTEEGYEFLTETVGIKTQLDLRGETENGGLTAPSFSSADNYVLVPLTAYSACFNSSQAELYREAFSLFADPENYPIYFHCAGGADRTGTLAAILLAYLGVSEDEIVQDYVVTTFSPVCYNQGARSRGTIMTVLNGLDNYNGTTLSEKAKSYLSSIGVTQRELYNIKAIMFGDSLDDYVPQKDYSIRLATNYYATASGEDFVINLNESDAISGILIDSEEVSFQQSELTLTIPASVFTNLEDGAHKGEVVFSDGTKTEFTVNVNFYDLTGGLEVSSTTYEGDYAYVEVVADAAVFGTINYHFHTRRSTLYPDVEPNILINGTSVADLNDNTDMSSYTWNTDPGKTDSRHRVPVSIYSNGNTMKLLCRADWLQSYLKGQEMTITLKEGFNYTYEDITYKVLSDIMYQYTNGSWMKVMSGQVNGIVSDELEIYSSDTDDLILTLTGNGIVKSISIDESAAAFTQNGKTITLSNSALEGLSYGEHSGVITFNDGATLSFTVNVLVDLSNELSFTGIEEKDDYTTVTVSATSGIFDGINYHFHTKRSTYPDVEPNILINGTSVADLNDNTDMSSYTWNTSPGSTDPRHRVPVTILSQNETMKLLIKSDWLESYLNGSALEIALKKGLAYTYGGITYELLQDITYTLKEKININVEAAVSTVNKGESTTLSATIDGSDTPYSDVSWSIEGAVSKDTYIARDGFLVVGADETAKAITVKATSKEDTEAFGTCEITIGDSVNSTPDGTRARPYLIASEADFKAFSDKLDEGSTQSGVYYKQTKNLDMTKMQDYIGITNAKQFDGIYDGNGHTINISFISESSVDNRTIFGYINNGTVINLGITGIISYPTEGNVVQKASFSYGVKAGGKIINCWSSVDLTGHNMGGITYSNYGTVANCLFTGTLSGKGTLKPLGVDRSGSTKANNYYLADAYRASDSETAITATQLKENLTTWLNSDLEESIIIANIPYPLKIWVNDGEKPVFILPVVAESDEIIVKVESTFGGTVEGGAVSGDQTFNKGEEITLTATPSADKNGTFKYWIEVNTGKIITEEETLTMSGTVGRNVRAVFGIQNERFISFYGKDKKTIVGHDTSTLFGEEPDASIVPSKIKAYVSGYNLIGWKLDNAGEVLQAGSLGTEGEKYYAVYEKIDAGTYSLTLGENATLEVSLDAEAIPYGSYVRVSAAAETEEGSFMYWMLGEEIVSYNRTYAFTMPANNITLTPVYGNEEVTEEVSITMVVNGDEADNGDGTKMAGFMITRFIPEGTEVTDTGIIYVRDSAYGTLTTASVGKTADNGKTVNVSISANKTSGQYKFNARYEISTGIKAIAFVTYEVDGETITVYSKAETVSKITE